MAERFNLTAQIQLQAPRNTAQVVSQIKKQLRGVNVDVKVKANSAQVAKLNKELQGVSKAGDASAKSVNRLNATLAQSARRFSVITVATGSFLALARGIKNGTAEAIAFERELIKISQVTGKSVSQLQGLTKEVTRLSTSLGASSSDLLNVSRTLAQAGFNATKTKQALETLAQTTLAATFDSIQDTTEGAIAVLRQFSAEARASGGEIKFLASTMDAINSVSKRFAVESGDLITAIRRVGGVFSSAGGSVNELIALFTSVRATTRESAETIATGLRTIFTRIQRTDTVDQLKQLGIQLRDSQGQFVGAYEAVRRLSAGLSTLDPRDFRFSDIVEELGGFRQVGKVIPLIQQFAIAQDALTVAQNSSGSVARDAAAAQAGLGVQLTKVKEEFSALLRQFADSSTFRSIAGGALQLASAFLKIASALENVLPLITALISLKIGQALAPGLGALIGGGLRGQRRSQGGRIHAFARGGHVPGTGNRDTVPAMLQPGEFVIKKSSAESLGSSTLEAMNNNRFKNGGKSKLGRLGAGEEISLAAGKLGPFKKALLQKAEPGGDGDAELDIGGAFLQPQGVLDKLRAKIQGAEILDEIVKDIGGSATDARKLLRNVKKSGKLVELEVPISIQSGSFSRRQSSRFRAGFRRATARFGTDFAAREVGLPFKESKFKTAYNSANKEQIEGGIFESFLNGLSEKPFDNAKINPNETFDFKQGLGSAAKVFGLSADLISDAKRTFDTDSLASLVKKGGNQIVQNITPVLARQLIDEEKNKKVKSTPEQIAARQKAIKKAAGGGISGSDTVPALLTPGEYVINKSAAQGIGYSNLNKMNQTGVKGFAAGGAVGGVQRFANGGRVAGGVAAVNQVAGAAQSFVLLTAVAGSLGSQFTNLEETTQAAISATSASVASVVGIGATLVQLFTAMATASTAAAAADVKEATASTAAAGGGGTFATALGAMTVAAIAVYTALEFFRQTLIAESAALTAGINETIRKLEEGKGTGATLAAEQGERLAKDVAAQEVSPTTVAVLSNLAGILTSLAAAAGLALIALKAGLGVLTVLTGPIGLVVAGIGVLVTGLVGMGGWGLRDTNKALEEGARAAELEAKALRESVDARVASIESLRLLNQSIDDLNQRNFADTPEGRSARIQARGGIVSQGLSEFGGGGITARANKELEGLAQRLNKTTSELKASDFKGENVKLKGRFENLIGILDKNAEGLKTTLQQAQTNFTAAVKEDVTGELGFDELRAKGGNFAKTLNDLQQATKASFQAEKQRLQALVNTTEKRKARDEAEKQLTDTIKREQKILNEQIKYGQDVVAGAQERYAADIQAAQAAQELSERLDQISQFGRSVALLSQSTEDAAKQMDLAIAAFSDGDIKVEIPAISGLTDPTNIADPARFDAQIDSLIADLPRAMQAEAGRQADTVRQASDLFGGFRSGVRGLSARSGREQTRLSEEILDASGVDISGKLRSDTLKAIQDALGQVGGITDADFDKIFSFAKDEADAAAKNLQDLNKVRQTELATYQKYIGAVNQQRAREDAARQKLLERELKNQELLAKARGESVDIEKREALRTAAAQDRLRGTGIRAGDARGAFSAIDQARVRRDEIANELAEARASGVDLGAKKFKELALEQDKYNNIIKRGKAELERLSSQGARASDILGQIAKEAQGRKQLANLATGFAFGSDEQRQSTAIALRDTRLGIQSGFQRRGLAGSTEQQRSNIANILGQLSDFRFRGVRGKDGKDLTGREIQAELAAQEIVRVTGDLEAAAAIREQVLKGSKEEQLITALEDLTKTMVEVRRTIDQDERTSSEAIAIGKARGGLIYREDGGSIFQPKGTDTVPAMLTPGEFVIRKSAVDRIGVGTLQALNSGSSQYFHVGGRVHDHPHPDYTAISEFSSSSRAEQRQQPPSQQLSGPIPGKSTDATGRVLNPRLGLGYGQGRTNAQFQKRLRRRQRERYQAELEYVTSGKEYSTLEGIKYRLADRKYGLSAASRRSFISRFPDKARQQIGPFRLRNKIFLPDSPMATSVASDPRYYETLSRSERRQIDEAAEKEFAARQARIQQNSPEGRKAFLEESRRRLGAKIRAENAELYKKPESELLNPKDGVDLVSILTPGNVLPDDLREAFSRQPPVDRSEAQRKAAQQEAETKAVQARLLKKYPKAEKNWKRFQRLLKRLYARHFGEKLETTKGQYDYLKLANVGLFSDDRKALLSLRQLGSGDAKFTRSMAYYYLSKEFGTGKNYNSFYRNKYKQLGQNYVSKANEVYNQNREEKEGKRSRPRPSERLRRNAIQRKREEEELIKSGKLFRTRDPRAKRFFAGGSAAGTSDTVPAMLTPGEFVMSREAVQSHGVGYMKNLNRGRVPGFRRGGVVGHGNVQYRQEGGQIGNNAGGILGLDTSNLSSILDNFNSDLMSGLDNVVSKFTGFSESFTLLSQSFSNLKMQHSFTGDMTLAFNITNTDAIKNAVATGITPKIVELISSQIKTELNRFRAGNS